MAERHLEYEKRENDILFFLSDHVRVSVKYNSATKVEVQMWRLDVLLPPDVGNMNAASFRKRLARDATEAFNRDSKEGENVVPKLEEELGLVANALKSKPEDAEGETGKLTLLDVLQGMIGPSMMDLLISYGREGELFHDPDGEPYSTVEVGDHRETYHLKSKGYRSWLRHKYYAEEKKRLEEAGKPEESPAVPRSQVINDALAQLEAICQFEGPEYEVHVRVAEHQGDIYIDLGDEGWRVVRVDLSGWQVLSDPPVKFIRPKGMLPLPKPERGSGLSELRGLLNLGVGNEADRAWRLIVAWLVQAFCPRGPYPVLIFQGPLGAAKSTAERILHHLVDPVTAPLRTTPKNERDLFIAATSGWVVAYDNISHLSSWLSDAICRLSTGGGFSTRTLYENREQELFDAMRPVILNGISDVATRSDLLDRSIIVTLPKMEDEDRRPEKELWAKLEEMRPAILGCILGAVSTGLSELSETELGALPRMADFALWVTAAEPGLGWEAGTFMDAYEENRSEATILALESDPVALATIKFMEDRSEWTGTATELLEKLGDCVSEDQRRSKAWPKAAHALTGRLKRLTMPLKEAGIKFSEDRVGHAGARTKRLEKIPPKERQQRQRRQWEGKDVQIEGFGADAPADAPEDADALADASKNGRRQQGTPANSEVFKNADAADASSRRAEDEENGPTVNGSRLREFFEDPPEWFHRQAAIILRDYPDLPDHLLRNISGSVAMEVFEDWSDWDRAYEPVKAKLEGMRDERAGLSGAPERCIHDVIGGCWLCRKREQKV